MRIMSSRERVLAAISHNEPDCIPVDLGATPSSGISAIAYNNLKKHMNVTEGHTRVYDVVQQLAQPEDSILKNFGVDVLDIGRMFNSSDEDWYDMILADGSRAQYPVWFKPKKETDSSWSAYLQDGTMIASMLPEGTFFGQSCYPYLDGYPPDYKGLPEAMSKVHWAGLPHSPWDHADENGFWETLREKALELRNTSEHALMIVCGCNLFEWGTFLRRMDNFLLDLVAEPKQVERLLDALMEQHLATLEKVCNAVGDVVDILRFGDDLGTNECTFMSPITYRELFKPRHTQLCQYVKNHSKMHTFLHSCGSIATLMPDLIEAGFDIINPVQINASGMDSNFLKSEFGKDITFWGGGCDTRMVLPCATPAEVKTHVLRQLEVLSPGGGFVFNTVHNILPDVPPQNIVAMYEAIHDFNSS